MKMLQYPSGGETNVLLISTIKKSPCVLLCTRARLLPQIQRVGERAEHGQRLSRAEQAELTAREKLNERTDITARTELKERADITARAELKERADITARAKLKERAQRI